MERWYVSHGQDGYAAHLVKVPWWALAVSQAAVVLDEATGHRFCGSDSPDWLWRIPVGKPRYDASVVEEGEEPFLINSVAGCLHQVFTWAFCLDLALERELHCFAVSAEVAAALGYTWTPSVDEDDE